MNRPRHILIIPDGNRRWAKARRKPAYQGHLAGARAFERIITAALDAGIPAVTVWGASVHNVARRSPQEVSLLFEVFKTYFTKLLKSAEVKKHGVRIRAIGRWEAMFPKLVQSVIRKCIESTQENTAHALTFLLAYNGMDEMRDAIMRIASDKAAHSDMKIDGECIKKHLWSAELPPVDLVIRTGGEPHLSTGVMMWDIADAHLYFTETLWPDFSPEEFKKALAEYARMEKRAGA